VICSIPPYESYLHEEYFSNKMKKEIYIFKDESGRYSTVFDKGYYQNARMCREIVTDVRL
jgi:uncharacterized protein YdeI (BOF family)